MNIKIIEFAGRQVLSGKVIAISQPVTDNIATTVKVTIKGREYIRGSMQDSTRDILFVDRGEKFRLATYAQQLAIGTKMALLVAPHNGMLFAIKATDESSFIWTLKDEEGNERTILYGPSDLAMVDQNRRFSRLKTQIGDKVFTSTFWNNYGAPLGENVRKVFEPRGTVPTFIVGGKIEIFQDLPYTRANYFICDF